VAEIVVFKTAAQRRADEYRRLDQEAAAERRQVLADNLAAIAAIRAQRGQES
jgi:hypothetical protein